MNATEFGKTVILHYFPQSSVGFASKRNFRLRSDDHKPSATVFFKENIWFLQDKGGADNKAYNAISLVMEREGLGYPQAIEWIAAKFAPHLLDKSAVVPGKPQPKISLAEQPKDAIEVVKKESGFTQAELDILGYKITEQDCSDLFLVPLEGYYTQKNNKGRSYFIQATDAYPIFYYDYGDWGKIYQPLGDIRFMYVGKKPENYVFGDRAFRQRFEQAEKDLFIATSTDEDGNTVDERWDELILCSGPSDALNLHASGYHVCWLNSETAELKKYDWGNIKKMAHKIYVLYDIDDTGLDAMYRLAMQYLELRVIRLPDDLRKYRTRKGGESKDAKDFFMYYRPASEPDPRIKFLDFLRTATSLQFWNFYKTKNGKYNYEINNLQLYGFLRASGYYTLPSKNSPNGFVFCKVTDNIIRIIEDRQIAKECAACLCDYLRSHTFYFSDDLVNMIYKSPQVKVASLENLDFLHPNLNAPTKDAEYIFFQNTAVKVSTVGLERIPLKSIDCMILDSKVIKHDIVLKEPFFDIDYTKEYAELLAQHRRFAPRTPEHVRIQAEIDQMTDIQKYRLTIHRNDFSFLQYVYNTGRQYWRKEENGEALSVTEQAETELHFINKVMALGYQLSSYKSPGQPYAVYGLETEIGEDGEHNGGTGKSLFMKSISKLKCQAPIDGQQYSLAKTEFLLQKVEVGITENVYIDDLNAGVDLHFFMPMITGDMVVNKKFCPAVIIPFMESPKIAFTSNHAIQKFDSSLRRRTWFVAFSDYYHAENPEKGMRERSPFTEFGKNLIENYTEEEMNEFYNFMINCLQVYKKLQCRIQPPMEYIEKRNMQREMGESFFNWAESYFDNTVTDRFICRKDLVDSYKASLSDQSGKFVSDYGFNKKLKLYCLYNGWTYNPQELLQRRSAAEQKRGEFRKKVNGSDMYFYYIDTLHNGKYYVHDFFDPIPSSGGGAGEDSEDLPLL